MPGSLEERIGYLTGLMEGQKAEQERASDSRRRTHEKIEDVADDLKELGKQVATLKETIDRKVLPAVSRFERSERRRIAVIGGLSGIVGTAIGVAMHNWEAIWQAIVAFFKGLPN